MGMSCSKHEQNLSATYFPKITCALTSPHINLMMDLSINTSSSPKEGSSPRGWRYVLLHSPRNGGSSALPLLVLFFGVGLLLGSTMWGTISSEQQHIKITTTSASNSADYTGSRNGSLPLCWLMSFPVSDWCMSCALYIWISHMHLPHYRIVEHLIPVYS